MTMTSEKLGKELRVVGDRLSDPPSDVDELITLLDQIEKLLSKVEQSPKGPLNVSTSLVLKALLADNIFRNSDADVQVAVASCLSEIIRITAPDAPYNDEDMKELLQLVVSTFEKLDDKSSRSYEKRIVILETTARVRSSVVMLDLECDALIIEMFNNFFKTLREYHPEGVLSSMMSIITLVLEESEDISPQLLSPILACLQLDNKGALPIAQKLAENVLQKCASKVKPYLVKAVEALGVPLDEYSPVVVSLCRDKCGNVEHSQAPTNEKVIDKVILAETTSADADMLNGKSPKSESSNDVTQAGKDEVLVDLGSTKTKELNGKTNVPKDADGLSNAEIDNLGTKHTELDKTSFVAGNLAAETLPVAEDQAKDLLGSINKNPPAELAVASENGKETNTEEEQAVSPVKDVKRSADDISDTIELETKSTTLEDVGEREKDLPTDTEAKPQKRLRKRVDRYTDSGSLRRKLSRPRASCGKDSPKSSPRNDEAKMMTSPKSTAEISEDDHDLEATLAASFKRKRSPAKEKAATSSGKDKNAEQFGENLVGSRIRVWWPIDRRFYKGVVDSYDSSRRKHRVVYDDGDKEHLYMRKEKWEFVEDNDTANEKEADGETSADATPELPEKKANTDLEESSQKEKNNDKKSTKEEKRGSSAKSKSKTGNGKKSKDAEKPKDDGKKDEKSREKSWETESNSKSKDKIGNVGGKIVAAASRLTGKSNAGGKPEDSDRKTPKSNKTTSEKKNSRPSSSKKNTIDHGKDDELSSDDDSKPLVCLLKKSPAAMKILKAKLNGKGVGEGSSGAKRKR